MIVGGRVEWWHWRVGDGGLRYLKHVLRKRLVLGEVVQRHVAGMVFRLSSARKS